MRNRFRKNASALVTTLFVVVVLSTIVMAFMGSMSLERKISGSMKNKFQAELTADAAQADAIAKLKITTTSGPMAAVWDLDANQTPYLYLAKRVISGNDLVTDRIPLFSTIHATNLGSTPGLVGNTHFTNFTAAQINSADRTEPDIDSNGAAVARSVRDAIGDISININAPKAALPNGPVGLLSAPGVPRDISANWIYVRDNSGRITGRYAYWLDDECSKLDLRYAGQAANAVGNHVRGPGTNFADLSLLAMTNATNAISAEALMNNILALKNQTNLPLRTPGLVKYQLTNSSSPINTNLWNAIRPFVTTFSLHDDRAPDGRRRLNLNEAVTTTVSATEIAQQTFAIRDAITNSLPNFALRYYSVDGAGAGSPVVPTPADQEIYATKIAANIRDFIDADSTATVISSNGTAIVSQAADDDFIQYDSATTANLPMAFGKEQGPFLSEYMRVVRVIDPDSPTSTAPSTPITIRIRFAHYVELYNPTGRTITYADLGPNPYVMLSNRADWNNGFVDGTPSVLNLNDIKLFLPENFSIAPGGYAVLTNDGPPWAGNQTDYMGLASNRFLCRLSSVLPDGRWEFINTGGDPTVNPDFEDYSVTTSAIGDSPVGPGLNGRYNLSIVGGIGYSAQRERLSFGNDYGIIDYSLRIFSQFPINAGRNQRNPAVTSTFLAEETTSKNTLSGDDKEARWSRGDVRSNTEISRVTDNSASTWRGFSVFSGNNATVNLFNAGSPASPDWQISSGEFSTIGSINYQASQATISGVATWRYGWKEFTQNPAGNHFVKNTNIFSLGELGAIYDPARHDIDGYRSLGATLRIGQSDAGINNRWANSSNASAMDWLGGRGNSTATSTNYTRNAYLLMDVFRTDTNVSGRVNPNSLIRDTNAIAFRSAIQNFTFTTQSTNQASAVLSGRTLNATATLGELRNFFTNKAANGFMTSVGDLSLAPVFWSTNQQLAGTSMRPGDGVSDAGREEFMRSTANLLTTQSLAYTIFIKAQSGRFIRQGSTDRFEPTATVLREVVVQLQPEYPPAPAGQPPYTPVAPSRWKTLFPYTMSHQ
jgi:hypothetical protein